VQLHFSIGVTENAYRYPAGCFLTANILAASIPRKKTSYPIRKRLTRPSLLFSRCTVPVMIRKLKRGRSFWAAKGLVAQPRAGEPLPPRPCCHPSTSSSWLPRLFLFSLHPQSALSEVTVLRCYITGCRSGGGTWKSLDCSSLRRCGSRNKPSPSHVVDGARSRSP
jgi:hypothetical protein